jgi:hypothetical protein
MGMYKYNLTGWLRLTIRAQYLDFKAGVCGTAFCQVLPPMSPSILALHEQFQRAMFEKVSGL